LTNIDTKNIAWLMPTNFVIVRTYGPAGNQTPALDGREKAIGCATELVLSSIACLEHCTSYRDDDLQLLWPISATVLDLNPILSAVGSAKAFG